MRSAVFQPLGNLRPNLGGLRDAFVFFYVLAQGANAAFFLADGEFQFFVEVMNAIEVLGAEQFQQQGGDLREIAESTFNLAMKAIIFGAFDHS
jgi:hypothetical protein